MSEHDTEEHVVSLFPQWRQAVENASDSYTYGDVIPHEWLIDHFGLEKPKHGTDEQFKKYQFDFLEAMEGFKNAMLVEHHMALENVRGRGYRILHPNEQTDFAIRQYKITMAREVRKAANLLHNIEVSMLTPEEQRENINARGKLAAIQSFTRKQLRPSLLGEQTKISGGTNA